MSIRSYLIIFAAVTTVGAGAGWYHSWRSGIIDQERARVALEALEASEAALDSIEAQVAQKDSIAVLATREREAARAEAEEAVRRADARVASAEARVRDAVAALDSVEVPPEATEVIEAQADQIVALSDLLSAQVTMTATADSLVVIWQGRHGLLGEENAALRDVNAGLRTALEARTVQAGTSFWDRPLVKLGTHLAAGYIGYELGKRLGPPESAQEVVAATF